MPITEDKAPSTLSGKAKRMYVAAWNSAYDGTCKDKDGDERDACASKIAWGAVKKKYKKGENNTWIPKADFDEALTSFSMYIDKAVYNKEEQEFRWHCVASDVQEDSYTDNMTLELFNSFIERIKSGEAPPEKYCTEYWRGGEPYVSVSHYSDQNGKAVPGVTESTYIDGERLKARGTFFKNRLGMACFDAINKDKIAVKKSEKVELNNPVRISIAFLDYKHRHKSNGEIFERKSMDDLCPWCILESITGEGQGKEYLDGHLIHYALTRVPVNKRTDVEVEMAVTRKEDAESIVGEVAEELEQEEKQFRSEALITMSEGEEETPEPGEVVAETRSDMEDDEEETDEEDEKKEKKKMKHKSSAIEEALSAYRSAYDEVEKAEAPYEEKLQTLQPYLEKLANVTKSALQGEQPTQPQTTLPELEAFRSEVNAQIGELSRSIQMLIQMQQDKSTVKDTQVPTPRSLQLQPNFVPPQQVVPARPQAQPGTLRALIDKSVGLT